MSSVIQQNKKIKIITRTATLVKTNSFPYECLLLLDVGLGNAKIGPVFISRLLLHRRSFGSIGVWDLMDGVIIEGTVDIVKRPLSLSYIRLFIKGCFMTSIKVGLSLGFFFNSR